MAHPSALETLIELAQRATDDAAKLLGAAIKAVDEAQQKLDMLAGYRDDYANRLAQSQMQGITPMAYQNFIAFMGKLDSAIDGQREVLKQVQNRAVLARTGWQEAERKRLSYTTLSNRAAEQALQAENKRDQKNMDEHAARQSYYRR